MVTRRFAHFPRAGHLFALGLGLVVAQGSGCDSDAAPEAVDPTLGHIEITLGPVDWEGAEDVVWDVLVGDYREEFYRGRVSLARDGDGGDTVSLTVACKARPWRALTEVRVRGAGGYTTPVDAQALGGFGEPIRAEALVEGESSWMDHGSRGSGVSWTRCVAGETVSVSLGGIEWHPYAGPARGWFDIGVSVDMGDRTVPLNALWDLEVSAGGDPPERVMADRIDSVNYGDGAGSVTHEVPCDAESPGSDRVNIDLVGLYPPPLTFLDGGRWGSPAPAGAWSGLVPMPRLSVPRRCLEDQHVFVPMVVVPALWDQPPRRGGRALHIGDALCRAQAECERDAPETTRGEQTYRLSWACEAPPDDH